MTANAHQHTDMLPLADFVRLGALAEVNRRVLHPVGLAMGVGEDGDVVLYDIRRNDDEGYRFDEDPFDPVLMERIGRFAALESDRLPARHAALGYTIQPVPAR